MKTNDKLKELVFTALNTEPHFNKLSITFNSDIYDLMKTEQYVKAGETVYFENVLTLVMNDIIYIMQDCEVIAKIKWEDIKNISLE